MAENVKLTGAILNPETVQGYSAYQVALLNGFEGTEEDWLKSLKGNGIDRIEKTATEGLVDTYTIYFTDGNTATYNVTNGKDGKDGVSVTHSWEGTILSVTSASGTTKANLKGEKGDKGDKPSLRYKNGYIEVSYDNFATVSNLIYFTGEIDGAISAHNTNYKSHNDIRILLRELSDKVNHFLDVDDTKKDQLSELLALIDENIEDIENIVANNVKYNDIINNLTTNLDNKALSAAQGVELKRLIEEVRTQIATAINAHNADGTAHAGLREVVDDLDTAVGNLTTKVTALENAKPNLEGYVTTEQLEAALGAYITDIDSLVGGGI